MAFSPGILRPVTQHVLQERRGQSFCRACLSTAVLTIAGNRWWSQRDADRIVDALFEAPGAFETLHAVCADCGATGTHVIRARANPME